MTISIIIPARFGSSRYRGKPLVKILGREMVLRVADICSKIKKVKVFIATDSKKIANVAKKNGYDFIFTSSSCLTGTDRVAEISKKINANIYLNVQGDEPLIKFQDIKKILQAKKKYPNYIICGYAKLNSDENENNPNIPKIVINKKNELLYISRSPIPSNKKNLKKKFNYLKQVCIYAFNKSELNVFNRSKKKTYLEKTEDIEIVRFLELGKKIKMIKLNSKSYAVDIPEDIKKIEKVIKKQLRIK